MHKSGLPRPAKNALSPRTGCGVAMTGSIKLTFPCEFTLKIFGLAGTSFETAALTIIRKHVPTFNDQMLQMKESSQGKYSSFSITFVAESQQQLDSLYRELSSSPDILMAL